MSRSLTLSVAQPCSESWAAMTPAAQGRHCAACAKTVVDFSRMSDAEMLTQLRMDPNGCGRFRADQLHRQLFMASSAPRWRVWLAATFALLGLRELVAQPGSAKPASTTYFDADLSWTTPEAVYQQPFPAVPDTLVIWGKVIDKELGDGLPGVMVRVEGMDIELSTNPDGTFMLVLPDTISSQQNLLFSSIGFAPASKQISTFTEATIVALAADVKGGFTTCGAPLSWRINSLWQQLTRPFRR